MALLTWLLAITAGLAVIRLVAPVARSYAEHSGIPAGRVAWILGIVALASAVALLFVFNALTR